MTKALWDARSIYTGGAFAECNPTWAVEDSVWKAKHVWAILTRNHMKVSAVCDVGCGAGEVVAQLAELLPPDCTFVGFDISSYAHDLSQSRATSRVSFVLGDVLTNGGTYDLALLLDVIEHLEDPFSFLREIRDRSRFTVLHIPLDLSAATVVRRGRLLETRRHVGHLHWFTKDLALQTLEDLGYHVMDWFYTCGSLDLPPKRILTRIARLPRRWVFSLNADFAARSVGGFSIMVLTENRRVGVGPDSELPGGAPEAEA